MLNEIEDFLLKAFIDFHCVQIALTQLVFELDIHFFYTGQNSAANWKVFLSGGYAGINGYDAGKKDVGS